MKSAVLYVYFCIIFLINNAHNCMPCDDTKIINNKNLVEKQSYIDERLFNLSYGMYRYAWAGQKAMALMDKHNKLAAAIGIELKKQKVTAALYQFEYFLNTETFGKYVLQVSGGITLYQYMILTVLLYQTLRSYQKDALTVINTEVEKLEKAAVINDRKLHKNECASKVKVSEKFSLTDMYKQKMSEEVSNYYGIVLEQISRAFFVLFNNEQKADDNDLCTLMNGFSGYENVMRIVNKIKLTKKIDESAIIVDKDYFIHNDLVRMAQTMQNKEHSAVPFYSIIQAMVHYFKTVAEDTTKVSQNVLINDLHNEGIKNFIETVETQYEEYDIAKKVWLKLLQSKKHKKNAPKEKKIKVKKNSHKNKRNELPSEIFEEEEAPLVYTAPVQKDESIEFLGEIYQFIEHIIVQPQGNYCEQYGIKNFSYTESIHAWFTDPQSMLTAARYIDPEKKHYVGTSAKEEYVIAIHTVPLSFDRYALTHGLQSLKQTNDTQQTYVSIGVPLVSDGKFGCMHYCVATDGVCFHRNFVNEDAKDVLNRIIDPGVMLALLFNSPTGYNQVFPPLH